MIGLIGLIGSLAREARGTLFIANAEEEEEEEEEDDMTLISGVACPSIAVVFTPV